MKFLLFIIFINKCYLLKLESPGESAKPPNEKLKFSIINLKNENFRENDNLSSNIKRQDLGGKSFNTEFSTLRRDLKFFISKSSKCNVQVSDSILIKKVADIDFIEHWILHNNVEDIEPKSVRSKDVNIRYFTFNKKMNVFTVYFNFDDTHPDKNELNITFQYDAINLIKSYNNFAEGTESDSIFLDTREKIDQDKLNSNNFNYNTFLWKLYNKNFPSVRMETISVEINYDLGRDFGKYNIISVDPKFNFKKVIAQNEEDNIIKYLWNGRVDSQEVLVMEIKFPLYFESCKYLSMNLLMVIVGSIFIVFVILMLYIVFNSVMFNDL